MILLIFIYWWLKLFAFKQVLCPRSRVLWDRAITVSDFSLGQLWLALQVKSAEFVDLTTIQFLWLQPIYYHYILELTWLANRSHYWRAAKQKPRVWICPLGAFDLGCCPKWECTNLVRDLSETDTLSSPHNFMMQDGFHFHGIQPTEIVGTYRSYIQMPSAALFMPPMHGTLLDFQLIIKH